MSRKIQPEAWGTPEKACVTLTFGEVAENGVKMQQIGEISEDGFLVSELEAARDAFTEKGAKATLYHLNDLFEGSGEVQAAILVVRGGLRALGVDPDDIFEEQKSLSPDQKCLNRGRVVNKWARYNLCYSDESQPPDYEKGHGTIISYAQVPHLQSLREKLPEVLGEKARDLKVEGNYYYDAEKTYIGWHGDTERRLVIGTRFGADFDFWIQYYQRSVAVGKALRITLHHGDLYVLSEKAVGTDWKMKVIPTLRHAAGPSKLFMRTPSEEETILFED